MSNYQAPNSQPFPFNPGTSPDVYYGGARGSGLAHPQATNNFRVLRTFRDENKETYAVFWELTLREWSGGRGKWAGSFTDFPNSYAYSQGVDVLNSGYIFGAVDSAFTNAVNPTGNLIGLHSENIFDTLIWGIGSGTNVSLVKETSATSPVPTAITYNPTGTASIISFGRCVIGGGTTDERLIVGLSDEPAQIIGDANGTVDATMHVDTEPMWWILQTSIPGATGFVILMQVSTNISTLLTTSATSDQPTVATPNVFGGGFLIKPGEFRLGNDTPLRCWFVQPKEHLPAGMLLYGAEKLGYVYSCNLEGTDIQRLNFNALPNGVSQAAYVHGGIVVTDGQAVAFHTGSEEINLDIFQEIFENIALPVTAPEPPTNKFYRCRGFAVQGDDLWALVEMIDRTATLNTLNQWWKFDWDNYVWHCYSEFIATTATAIAKTVLPASSFPISQNTRFSQFSADALWYRSFHPMSGENLFFSRNQSAVTKNYADVQRFYTPRWTLPDLAGYPSVIESLGMTGDLTGNAMGAIRVGQNDGNSSFILGAASEAQATFNDTDFFVRRHAYWKRFPDNTAFFEELVMAIEPATNSSSASSLVTAVRVRGITFLDGVVRSPRMVLGA